MIEKEEKQLTKEDIEAIEALTNVKPKEIAHLVNLDRCNIYQSYRIERKYKFYEIMQYGAYLKKTFLEYNITLKDITIAIDMLKELKGKKEDGT